MKAIINISNKHSQYSKLNGLTFEVKELMNDSVGLVGVNPLYPNGQTDFHFSEILIVDIKKEFEEVKSYNSLIKLLKLLHYLQIKKIQF